MTPLRLALLVAVALWAAPADAQTPSEGPIIDWLVQNEISIRKTFDGKSKEESEPAKVSYNNPHTGTPFWLVDLGVKFSEWDLCASCTGKSVIVYPILEWHRSTSSIEATNKIKVGPSVDIHVGDLTQRAVALIALLKATYERDAIKDVNSGNVTALVGLMGANKKGGGNTWLPMSHVNDGDGNLVFRYAPFAGVEHYDNLIIEKKGFPTIPPIALSALAIHLQMDLYPFNRPGNPGWFEITASGAYRRTIGGDETVDDTLTLATISANIYFDRGRHFAIGLDHETGRNPKNNFDNQHATSVGFKVKF